MTNLSRIFWAGVMILRAKGLLRKCEADAKDYEAALKHDREALEYYIQEIPKRRMELILAQIEYDAAMGRSRT